MIKNKQCYSCNNNYDINNFYKDKTRTDGISVRCKNCEIINKKIYAEKRKNAYILKPFNKNCRNCKNLLSYKNCSKSFIETHKNPLCRTCQEIYRRKNYAKIRQKVLEALGEKCETCGENCEYLLSIDHINGNGIQERKKIRGAQYLKKILKNPNIKNIYRLLCYNCNYTLGFFGIEGIKLEMDIFNENK